MQFSVDTVFWLKAHRDFQLCKFKRLLSLTFAFFTSIVILSSLGFLVSLKYHQPFFGCYTSTGTTFSSIELYLMFSHIFRTEFVWYNHNYTKAAKRPACIIEIILTNEVRNIWGPTHPTLTASHHILIYAGTMSYNCASTRMVGLIVHSVERMEYHGSAVCYVAAGRYGITSWVTSFLPWGVWYFFRCVKEWFVAQ